MCKKYLFPLCLFFSCFIAPSKSLCFDYKTYSKQIHNLRIITPSSKTITPVQTQNKIKKKRPNIVKEFATKLLNALNSDIVTAKLFETSSGLSIYIKPAKISKIGVKYRF